MKKAKCPRFKSLILARKKGLVWLPYKGDDLSNVTRRLLATFLHKTKNAAWVVFIETIKRIPKSQVEEPLPAFVAQNIIYSFTCTCGSSTQKIRAGNCVFMFLNTFQYGCSYRRQEMHARLSQSSFFKPVIAPIRPSCSLSFSSKPTNTPSISLMSWLFDADTSQWWFTYNFHGSQFACVRTR